MHTDNLALAGPAGEGQHRRATSTSPARRSRSTVRVQPSLSTVVSTGAGAAAVMLLAANPLVGAAVGAGTLLAQKIMQDPIEQMFSYEYSRARLVVGAGRSSACRRARRPPLRTGPATLAPRDAALMRVAAVQMVSGGDVGENLAQAERADRRRPPERAPSSCCCPSTSASSVATPPTSSPSRRTTARGRSRRSSRGSRSATAITLVGGCVPLRSGDPARVRSACLVYGPDGTRVARYDKMHLFRYRDGDERYDESRTIEPGTEAASLRQRRRARRALDLLRPALPGALPRAGRGVALILVPAAFTVSDGRLRTGSCCCARARSRTSATCSRPRRAARTRTGGARSATRCSSIRGARSWRGATRGRAWSSATSIRRGIADVRGRLPALGDRVLACEGRCR